MVLPLLGERESEGEGKVNALTLPLSRRERELKGFPAGEGVKNE